MSTYSAYTCVFSTYYHLCAKHYARFQSNKVHALKRVTFWGKETQAGEGFHYRGIHRVLGEKEHCPLPEKKEVSATPFHYVEHYCGHVVKQEWTIISREITTRKNETKGLTR